MVDKKRQIKQSEIIFTDHERVILFAVINVFWGVARQGRCNARDHRRDGLDNLTMAIGTNHNRAEGQYYINTQKLYREGPTQRTVLWLEWAWEGWRPSLTAATEQEQHCWWPISLDNIYRTLVPQQLSGCVYVEWAFQRVAQISRQLSVCHASGISSAGMGKYRQATLIPWQLSICLQHGEETRARPSGEATWAFLTGMEQPPAISATSPIGEERESQASRPYGTPLVDLKQMLEGDVP